MLPHFVAVAFLGIIAAFLLYKLYRSKVETLIAGCGE
jgi:hypothetical protein